jgi:uncharacterized protein with ACT and thioredoxin-like domain
VDRRVAAGAREAPGAPLADRHAVRGDDVVLDDVDVPPEGEAADAAQAVPDGAGGEVRDAEVSERRAPGL